MFAETIIIGNLGSDPEMRFTPGGKAVTSFSVATSEKWTGADGKPQERTTWWRVSVWDKQAEIVEKYLKKGRQVMVKGRVEARAFTDKSGEVRASLELTANTVKFLGSNPNGEHTAVSVAPVTADEDSVPF